MTKMINTLFRYIAKSSMVLVLMLLSGCSIIDEEGTGHPLKLNVDYEETLNVSESALSEYSPCHIVVYTREKSCSPFYLLFEDNAYISSKGELKWMGKFHYWPGTYCKFVAYWPVDSNVILDETGNVISADCKLLAVSDPYCQFTENPVLIFKSYYEEEKQETQESKEEEKGEPIRFDVSVTDYKR